MTQMTEDRLQQAREAFARNDWGAAYELFAEVERTTELEAADLVTLAESAWWIGQVDHATDAYERAYSAAMEKGDRGIAAQAAIWRVFCAPDKSSPIVQGWLANARRLLDSLPESEEHGMLSYALTNFALGEGRIEEAYGHAKRTLEIGDRIGSKDLVAIGLFDQGNTLIAMGKVDEGFPLLDEAMVAAVSGDLKPRITGTIYCSMISTCSRMADYRRAAEWTDAAERWCGRQSIHGFPGLCRVYRAGIMKLRGAWDKAESEALLAQAEVGQFSVSSLAEAFYEIGEIRLRVGDIEAAEDAFREAHQLGRDPAPGLALLRMQQGDARNALAMINRSVSEQSWDRLATARLLPAQVEIAVAAGDGASAGDAATRLADIAETYASTALKASSACANGIVALAEEDAESAIRCLRTGLRLWREIDAPYEAARARLNLAQAYRAAGDVTSFDLELSAARNAFEKLGAGPDLLRATQIAQPDESGETVAGPREQRTFMFTDICRSTDLMEAVGEDAWQDILHWHDTRLRSLFVDHAGEEIKHSGDGFFVAFPDPDSAIDCAVAIQRALSEHRRAAGFAPQVRIGLHEGKATRRGSDYFGRGVNIAARIGAKAGAGEILTSSSTISVEKTIAASEPRSVTLKGIAEPIDIVSITWR